MTSRPVFLVGLAALALTLGALGATLRTGRSLEQPGVSARVLVLLLTVTAVGVLQSGAQLASAAELFTSVSLVQSWALAAAGGALLVVGLEAGLRWWAARSEMPRRVLSWDLALLLPLALGTLYFGAQARAELRATVLPSFTLRGCAQVHVGVDCQPQIVVDQLGVVTLERGFFGQENWSKTHPVPYAERNVARGFESIGGWRVVPVLVPSQSPGDARVLVSARRPGMEVQTWVDGFQVLEDRGDARLPIEQGYSWRFSTSLHTRQHMGWTRAKVGEEQGPDLHIIIGAPLVSQGLRRWPVYSGPPASEVPVGWLIRVNGQTRTWSQGEGIGAPAFVFDVPEREAALVQTARGGVQASPCSLSILPQSDCFCGPAAPEVGAELAGPVGCVTTSGGGLGHVVVGLLSLGMAPGAEFRTLRLTLESSAQESGWTPR